MLRSCVWAVGVTLFLSASMGFAQMPGDPNATPRRAAPGAAVPLTAHPKPFTSFTAVGSGTADVDLSGPCATVSCPGTDSCQCLTISGAKIRPTGLGKSTLTASINLDANTNTPNGAGDGFCDLASGPGTITAANGDTISIDFTGSFCVGFTFLNFVVNGGYTIVGGTGRLASAAGTGNYAVTASEVSLPGEAAVTMNGTFRKKP
ncbi:MAG TPA: hypothetical protein VMV15_01640 [Candidatus Binataceae bacterium]|nr:hypothetical protein [Candidatus Binataceae bacterium]